MSEAPIIRVRGLVTRFGKHTVHDGLDLDVQRGEIIGVVKERRLVKVYAIRWGHGGTWAPPKKSEWVSEDALEKVQNELKEMGVGGGCRRSRRAGLEDLRARHPAADAVRGRGGRGRGCGRHYRGRWPGQPTGCLQAAACARARGQVRRDALL